MLNFTQLIEDRTGQFTGREWVFGELDDWLKAGKRMFLLAGDPGTGKTAIAARLVQTHLGSAPLAEFPHLRKDCLAYFHFCQSGGDGVRMAERRSVQRG